ncbi:unnamed protein product [Microthlaspi erraticum]|uniref:F-box domain-containing protein n=1 Tax=Microthlaspi erraticum TaxID=1685480 RepID=A0A6D2IET0_9BRAS|nr:unnamed protein product [Microthlaspi erraticum]
MAEKEQSSEPPPSLPEDVIVDILARVPRCNYPTLSLVSKHFRSLVASREIYARRSLLGCTEHCLYVVLSNRKRYVAMGSKIYVFNNMTSLSIDCISHTAQPLPSMPVVMDVTNADIIDGRIYVIGYIGISIKKVMVVFNTETQTWEPETIKIDTEVDMWTCECVVMGGKMYFRDNENSLFTSQREVNGKQTRW